MSLSVEPSPAGPRYRRFEPKDLAPLASLLVIGLFMAIATQGEFLRLSTVVNVLKQGSVLMMVSAGLTYVLLCGEIDLAVGMIALWTACLCGWTFQKHIVGGDHAELLTWLALGGALLTSVGLGLISGSLTVWARLPSFIITLAMMYIADGAARFLTKSETFNVPDVLKTLGNSGLSLTPRFTLPYSALVAGGVAVVGHVVLQHTRFGRYVYMTGGNREAARLSGVRTGLIVVACLAVSAFTAGLGGLINAGRLNSISLDQNRDLLLSAVACVVLGGTSLFGGEGGIGRTVLGVITFTVLSVGLTQIDWINDLARQLLMGVVLLAALVVNGLLARRRS